MGPPRRRSNILKTNGKNAGRRLLKSIMPHRKPYTGTFLRGKEGFTLVELLLMVAILSILVAIAIPMYNEFILKAYKAQLDMDAKHAYTASQTYLVNNPDDTLDSLGKLLAGGYQDSPGTAFVDASMTVGFGNVEIYSTSLNSGGLDNNAVIFWNGRIEFSNVN